LPKFAVTNVMSQKKGAAAAAGNAFIVLPRKEDEE
jgi:hypothetical protein